VLAAGRGPGLSNALVSSFDAVALERVAHLAPSWSRWLNLHALGPEQVAVALGLGCRGVWVDWRALDRRSMARARDAGLEVAAFTVRRRATFDRLARLGVVAVCVEAAALDGPAAPSGRGEGHGRGSQTRAR
jgi:glycerophosphoryl diester phosphodiesterase